MRNRSDSYIVAPVEYLGTTIAMLWTPHFSARAQREHWDVWLADEHPEKPEIQRLDLDPGPFTDNDMPDKWAVTHVAVMAIFGLSELHMLALKLEYKTNREHYDKL